MKKILISIAVYDTDENERAEYTKKTYQSLVETINPKTTDVAFINNNSCKETTDFLNSECGKVGFYIENLSNNIGTAEAVNRGWHEHGESGMFLVKLDNDVTFDSKYWADDMAACLEADPSLGVLGLKRKDLPNSPGSSEYPTELCFASREFGSKWHVIEKCNDIIGTCHMINPALFEKIGYLYQPRLYGFDDVIMCHRSNLAGFQNAFYPSVGINHVDNKETEYIEWKRKYAGIQFEEINKIIEEYNIGSRSLYYNPFL